MKLRSIEFAVEANVAHIAWNEADRGNPIDEVFTSEFREAAELCAARSDIRAVLISARGKYFSVGGDLKRLAQDRHALPSFVSRMLVDMCAAISALAQSNAPVIASVNGIVAGGSVGLVAGCDLVYASPAAAFVPAFTAIGLCPDSGSSYYLPRRVGTTRAKEFYLLGESWNAETARNYGLINRIVPAAELESVTRDVAARLAASATLGLGETKRLLNRSLNTKLEEQLLLEAGAITRLTTTDDTWEGITAMLAKRPPNFRSA
jgi:2-(1,2-epoxy-1,2-dihydrophenyl)acetyl-CoA isomerase